VGDTIAAAVIKPGVVRKIGRAQQLISFTIRAMTRSAILLVYLGALLHLPLVVSLTGQRQHILAHRLHIGFTNDRTPGWHIARAPVLQRFLDFFGSAAVQPIVVRQIRKTIIATAVCAMTNRAVVGK